jgi:hypothetical protein
MNKDMMGWWFQALFLWMFNQPPNSWTSSIPGSHPLVPE